MSSHSERKAGSLEHFQYVRTQLGLSLWVTVSAKYRHDAGAPLDRSTLFVALERVVYAHPALVSRPMPCPEAPSILPFTWVRLPSLDLNRVVDFYEEDSTHLESILTSFYAAPVQCPDDLPLWKLFVLSDATIVFAYDHTIADGQSGMGFHAALLSALRQLQGPVLYHSGLLSALPEDVALVPPLEDSMDVSVPFRVIAGALYNTYVPSFLRRNEMAWAGNPVPKSITHGSVIHILRYPPKDAAWLLQLSRLHSTTITGTLHALALVVLSGLIRTLPDANIYRSIATVIPVSLRRYTGTSPIAFCNHVSSYSAHHSLLPPSHKSAATVSVETFPWHLAADFSATLKREASRSVYLVGLLKYVLEGYEKYLLSFLGKKRPAALEISNLGPFPVDSVEKPSSPGASWRIDEVIFAHTLPVTGAAFVMGVSGAESGGLGVTITWGKEAVDQDFAEAFVTGFAAGIQGLLASREC
ncbi:alcohol acetyltransferase [Trametes punicea]|nr:alcohol acetyltransferase [Trametes punicea]